jgi:hypothetical protein
MDFNVFGHLLRGAPPLLLCEVPLGHQKQKWNLREYIITEDSKVEPLPMGSPLYAHLPTTAVLREHAGELLAQETGSSKPIVYIRSKSRLASGMAKNTPAKDIIILGDVSCFYSVVIRTKLIANLHLYRGTLNGVNFAS